MTEGNQTICQFRGDRDEIYWYKYVVPSDIGNESVFFAVMNNADDKVYLELYDSNNMYSDGIGIYSNSSEVLISKVKGSYGTGTIAYLEPGKTYYLKFSTDDYCSATGSVSIVISREADDNLGDTNNAQEIPIGTDIIGAIENVKDLDCFKMTMPNDNKKYQLQISGKNIDYSIVNNGKTGEGGFESDSTSIDKINIIGQGQICNVSITHKSYYGNTGTYKLRLEDTTLVTTTAAPGTNWGDTSKAIALPMASPATGKLEKAGDVSCYKLDIPKDGKTHQVTLTGEGAEYNFVNGDKNETGVLSATPKNISVNGDGQTCYLYVRGQVDNGTYTVTLDSAAQATTEPQAKVDKPVITSAANKKKKKIVVTWSNVSGAEGYQVQYALNKGMTKKAKIKAAVGQKCTLGNLKKKKKYFIRVKAYTIVNGNKVYGEWSAKKKVKVKK